MRLFLAIPLPDDVRAHLGLLQEALRRRIVLAGGRRISWTRDPNLHLTLKFLGEVPDAGVPALRDALAAAPLGPSFESRANGVTHFPPRGPVNVIASTTAGDVGRAVDLAAAIDRAVEPLGFPRERRPFTPHITIARANGAIRGDQLSFAGEVADAVGPGPAFRVEQVVLMRSDLRPTGAVYTAAERFPL